MGGERGKRYRVRQEGGLELFLVLCTTGTSPHDRVMAAASFQGLEKKHKSRWHAYHGGSVRQEGLWETDAVGGGSGSRKKETSSLRVASETLGIGRASSGPREYNHQEGRHAATDNKREWVPRLALLLCRLPPGPYRRPTQKPKWGWVRGHADVKQLEGRGLASSGGVRKGFLLPRKQHQFVFSSFGE